MGFDDVYDVGVVALTTRSTFVANQDLRNFLCDNFEKEGCVKVRCVDAKGKVFEDNVVPFRDKKTGEYLSVTAIEHNDGPFVAMAPMDISPYNIYFLDLGGNSPEVLASELEGRLKGYSEVLR